MPLKAGLVGVAVVAIVGIGTIATAQQPRYRSPAGNPLPNALNYFRRDVGVLDPYNAFVQPNRQLTGRLQELDAQEQSDYRRTQNTLNQVRRPQAAATGSSATFMNYSHFYPAVSRGGNLRRR